MNHPLTGFPRIAARSVWLAAEIVLALVRFVPLIAAQSGIPNHVPRARWLQRACRRALRVFNLRLRVTGPIPFKGLLVCNHLSYLDILVLGAIAPCTFVSKNEVKRWPVFGWFALLAGTLFVRRDKRSDVLRAAREIRHTMDNGSLVVLFPEGTTSDGRQVLPFKTSLLQAAQPRQGFLSAASIDYALADGDVAEEVCYWRDMTLLPHLLNLFTKNRLTAEVRFAELRPQNADRKQLARQLHSEVIRLKALSSAPPVCSRPRSSSSSSSLIGGSKIQNVDESLVEASL